MSKKNNVRDQVVKHIPSLINSEHNENMRRPITIIEVERVVHQMVQGNSLGLDETTINFFHHCWGVVGE